MSRAFVFPGQGAQSIGMGKALAETFPAAKAVFEEVSDALGFDLSALIWDGDIATLTLTQNAQPALVATSIAAFRAAVSRDEAADARLERLRRLEAQGVAARAQVLEAVSGATRSDESI